MLSAWKRANRKKTTTLSPGREERDATGNRRAVRIFRTRYQKGGGQKEKRQGSQNGGRGKSHSFFSRLEGEVLIYLLIRKNSKRVEERKR